MAVIVVAIAMPTVAAGVNPFTDVPAGRFFTEPVEWAFDNNITTGQTPTLFDPDGAVTRGESVTFLKRYNDNIVGQTINQLHCTTGQTPKYNGTTWTCGIETTNTDTLASLSCTSGQVALQEVGGWMCRTATIAYSPTGWGRRVLGASPTMNSIAIGTDGNPIIAYYEHTNDDLLVFHCSNPACTAGTATTAATVTSQGSTNVGNDPSIAIGFDSFPLIVHGTSGTALSVFHCTNITCTAGTTTLSSLSGHQASVAIGTDGLPVFSYRSGGLTNDLRVYHCADIACTTGTSMNLDSAGRVGEFSSIAIGVDGFPVISYHDQTNGSLKVFHCTDVACTNGIATTADDGGSSFQVGWDTSIAIGTDGNPVISYLDLGASDLKVYHCTNVACTNGTARTVDFQGFTGWSSSIAISSVGYPVIAYQDETGSYDLRLYQCSSIDCSTGNSATIDAAGNTGYTPSIAVGTDGHPVVTYRDASELLFTRVTIVATGITYE